MSKWIRTSEQMPPVGEPVLVLASGKPYKNVTCVNAMDFGTWYGGEGWLIDAFPDWRSPEVRWWMELPELPEEENDAAE